MNRNKLLELSAKAAAVDVHYISNGDLICTDWGSAWNPLEDEHDAFVLHNLLKIDINYCSDSVVAQGRDVNGELVAEQIIFDYDGFDVGDACRMAITNVAARIGQSMIGNMSEREQIASWVADMCQGLDANTIAEAIRNDGNDAVDNFKVR